MTTADLVVHQLRARRELWQSTTGVTTLSGDALARLRQIAAAITREISADAGEEWPAPPLLGWDVLERAGYFGSFPGWLTAACHLPDDAAVLERVAASSSPSLAAAASVQPPAGVLPPASCYHVYARLAGRVVHDPPLLLTTEGTCWRHEGDSMRPLERGWAFTMRELVVIGRRHEVAAVLASWRERVVRLADILGTPGTVEPATDPFFAPTAAGRAALQRVKGLKHELRLPVGDGRTVAAASINDHETRFGEAFGILLQDGSPCHSGCVAFGLERWLLAALCREARLPLPMLMEACT
jgi:seryl-tRNA synthetase